jgi:type 1 fimbria pilin
MKKTLLATIFTSLLIFSIFASSVIADDVTITIKGGFGCTVTIQNNGNNTINASISIVSYRIFREGGANMTGNGPIKPGESVSLRSFPPGIESVYAMAQVGNQTLVRIGISIFYFVLLFR